MVTHLLWCQHLITLAMSSQPQTMTGPRLWVTHIKRGRSGRVCHRSWEGKGKMWGCQEWYLRRLFSRFFSSGPRCEWWPHTWARCWGYFIIVWPDGSRKINRGGSRTESDSTSLWINQCRRRFWREWRSISWGGIIRPRSILWHGRLWASVRKRRWGQGHSYLKVGGNRIFYTCKECGQRQSQWMKRIHKKRRERRG